MPSETCLFDTHVHIDPADDLPALLAAARNAGVQHLLIAAANYDDGVRARTLAAAEPGVSAAVGLHPHEAASFADDLDRYRELARSPGVAAIGEIGLDYYYEHSERAVQRRVFSHFLRLAAEEQLPAVIHCRDAHDDLLPMLRAELAPGQAFEVHSFTGTPDQAAALLEMGAYISFNGMLTFKKAENIRAAYAAVPLDRVLAETDSPYLAPVPYRG